MDFFSTAFTQSNNLYFYMRCCTVIPSKCKNHKCIDILLLTSKNINYIKWTGEIYFKMCYRNI